MAEQVNNIYEPLAFDKIKILLASPEKIREWATRKDKDGKDTVQQVKKAETINYRTLKPEKDGLFCEAIFGPTKDWECHCGKYKKIRYKGVICEKCGVEVTKANVRRERMACIELNAPVSHIWYFKGTPSRMAIMLGIGVKELDHVLYFASYVVTDQKNSSYPKGTVMTDKEYLAAKAEAYANPELDFEAGMGAQAIKKLLMDYSEDPNTLVQLSIDLHSQYETAPNQEKAKLFKRIEVVDAFIASGIEKDEEGNYIWKESGNKPVYMILDVLPVIPPDLRPMVQLDGGRFATSDLNDLYRRIINRNNRLQQLKGQPLIILRNEMRMLQEAVDALIDNGRRGRPQTGAAGRQLKSLSDMLKGKQGRFRQNLLGKRVDYSGRSVIVVGPELKIYQCGLPKEMALELFKPFVMKELVKRELANNIKQAKKKVDRAENEVWDVLEDVICDHPVMLNRAPTLHRLGIQAFEPVLVEGKAIKLHPLVCTAFNADFDGDQMAVHVPLSEEAQAECRFLLLSPNNLLKPSDGGPVAVPSQDMVLGIYYLTQERPGAKGEGNAYISKDEAVLAYENGCLDLHARIKVRVSKEVNGETVTGTVSTTLGRLIFNEKIPQDLGYVSRKTKKDMLLPEVDFLVAKGDLKKILQKVITIHGATVTAEVLDSIKALGYKYSTRAAMTVSIADMQIPPEKETLLAEADAQVAKITKNFKKGLITQQQRYEAVIDVWKAVDKKLTEVIYPALGEYNNIYMMAVSGARGSASQIKQLIGWRGLFSTTSGHTIELPVRSNFREGLNVLEYFMSAHGSRKGMSDTALRTADSGYLTRRLVDVAQDIIIREEDCAGDGEIPYMEVAAFKEGNEVIEKFKDRLVGRFAAETICDENGEILVEANQMISPRKVEAILKALEAQGKTSMKIRNALSCKSQKGVCAKCYGANMATGDPVQVGEAVGIIAAQSIGEPGTQLTMRTFHTGGVAGGDITNGLPRVEELFEARNPKGQALITEIAGVATVIPPEEGLKKTFTVEIRGEEGTKKYEIPYGAKLADGLEDGTVLNKGDKLTKGSISPKELLEICGLEKTQDYLLREVQRPYHEQGVDINDKHIEIIVRQMLKKVEVTDPGDWADVIKSENVDRLLFDRVNEQLIAEGKKPAEGKPIIKGITKASLSNDSFLAAAAFQETTKVLTEAAIKGKVDNLDGLKENVLIGNLIPAGTGMKQYRDLKLTCDDEAKAQIKEKIERSRYEAALQEAARRREENASRQRALQAQAEDDDEESELTEETVYEAVESTDETSTDEN